MIVDLPVSGAKATLREKLTAKDKFAVQKAAVTTVDSTTGIQEMRGASLVNDMRNALLTRIIESWTVEGVGIPSIQADALDELDIDDYLELCKAVEPLMEKIVSGGIPNPLRQSSR